MFEIKNNGCRVGLHSLPENKAILELEKQFVETGEEQNFITHAEESDGFMEPKDYFEITCTLKTRKKKVGWWTFKKKQIY